MFIFTDLLTSYSTHIPARVLYQKEVLNFAGLCVFLYDEK
jgi:hypothetical protein